MQARQTEHPEIKLFLTDEFHRSLHNVQQKKTEKHELKYEEQNCKLFVF
jgi:hypothetical protein